LHGQSEGEPVVADPQLKHLDGILAAYGVEVEALAVSSRYEEPVKALTCFFFWKEGIKNLFALTMITEIGDVKRFVHPRQLVSWAGMFAALLV
jgi:transposase